MKDGKNMRKKLIAAMMAGVLSAGMLSTGVFAADTDLKGEVNTFIAASLKAYAYNPSVYTFQSQEFKP